MEKALYIITGLDVDYIVTCENEDMARTEFTTLFNQTIVNIKKLPLEELGDAVWNTKIHFEVE